MEESYRIDSVFEHRLSVSFPRFSQFLSSFPLLTSLHRSLLPTALLLTRYRSCISPLSTGVSALKYLVNLDEARKSRTRRVSEKGTAKKGNCARCHNFFFRSFSPSFSFSFFFFLLFFVYHSSFLFFDSRVLQGYASHTTSCTYNHLDCGQNLHASYARSPSGKFGTIRQSTCVREHLALIRCIGMGER